jgi:hypothetical protein
MIRSILLYIAVAITGPTGASGQTETSAQPALERGKYLATTIMACGNYHRPKDSSGVPIADRELSGGVRFTIPPVNGTASNITPDHETGIGNWSD